DERGVAGNLLALAEVARRQRDPATAWRCYREWSHVQDSITGSSVETAWRQVTALEGMARLAADAGRAETATRPLAAAHHRRAALAPLPMYRGDEGAGRELGALRGAIDAATFPAAWEQGWRMTAQQAVADALSGDTMADQQ